MSVAGLAVLAVACGGEPIVVAVDETAVGNTAPPVDLLVEVREGRATAQLLDGALRFKASVRENHASDRGDGWLDVPLSAFHSLSGQAVLDEKWNRALRAGHADAHFAAAPFPFRRDLATGDPCREVTLGAIPCVSRTAPFPVVPAFTIVPGGVVLLLPPRASPPSDLHLVAPFDLQRMESWRPDEPASFLTSITRAESVRRCLLLPPPATLRLDVVTPPEGELRFAATLDRLGAPVAGAGATLLARLGEETIATVTLDDGERFVEPVIDLARFGGQSAPLSIEVRPGGGNPVAVALCNATLRARTRPTAARSAPSVLLVTVDTLRADALGAYGSPRPTSPRLDALATRALVFDEAFAPAPWTLPSVTSILTGVQPTTHQAVVENAEAIPYEAVLLSERFRGRGYRTYGFVANPEEVGSSRGFDRGLEVLDQIQDAPAATVVDETLAFLGGLDPSEPFFAWVMPFDPHQPYRAPEPYRTRFLASGVPFFEPARVFAAQAAFLQKSAALEDPRMQAVLEAIRAQYDGEVAALDQALGRLFDGLEALGRSGDTIVVVTADHGEAFGEHGELGHGAQLFRPELRVPLLLAGPGLTAGRSDAIVSTTAIAPTLLSLAGLPADGALLTAPDRAAWIPSETRAFEHPRYGWRGMILALRRDDLLCLVEPTSERIRVTDLATDPNEENLREVVDGPEHEACRSAAKDYLGRPTMTRQWAERLSPERVKALKALGYLE